MQAEQAAQPRGINNQCREQLCVDTPIVGLARPELNGWCEEHLREHFPAEWAKLFARESGIKGKTEPRLFTPELRQLTRDTSLGYAVCDFADKVLCEPLLPWQRWAVIHALELNLDGTLRFLIVLILVARQNGKTSLSRTVSLFKLFMMSVKLVLGTAQSLDQAEDTWQACIDTIRANPWLSEEFARESRRTGRLFFETMSGGQYKVKANNASAGRGPSADHVNADELRLWLNWKGWSALSKTTNARINGQIWALSNAGDDSAVVLNQLRARAGVAIGPDGIAVMEEIGDPSIFIAEWSGREGCDLNDMEQLAQSNPGLGYTVREIALLSAINTDPPGVYRAEVLCQRVDQLDGAVDLAAWKVCADPTGELIGDPKNRVLCLDVALDGTHVALLGATKTADGRIAIQVVGDWPTVDECRADLRDMVKALKPRAFAWFKGGPAAPLGADIRALASLVRGMEIIELVGTEVPEACQSFAEQVASRKLIHSGDPLIDAHIAGAKRYQRGDGWCFVRRGATQVNAAYAAAGAVHVLRNLPPPKPVLIPKVV